jgi:putative flippase GtrA
MDEDARLEAHSKFVTANRFIVFCGVGVLNTIVDLIVYVLITRVLPFSEYVVSAKAISYVAATLFSFFMNKRFTFGLQTEFSHRELVNFFSTVGLGIFINTGTQYVAVHVLHIPDLIGLLIAAAFTAVWGFSFSHLYVFKR